MTAQADPWIRVPYGVLSDPQHQGLSLAARGLWTILKIVADSTYPRAAMFPRSTEDAELEELISRGLVKPVGGDCYRMPELDDERERRTEEASNAGRRRAATADRNHDGTFKTTGQAHRPPA